MSKKLIESDSTPLLIMGMHRSGTSLVTRLLREMGVFVGWRLDENAEATYFIKQNRWLLRLAGGSWWNPDAIEHLLEYEEARERVVEMLREGFSSPRALEYLGPKQAVSLLIGSGVPEPWGWKDPRNTWTLPIWKEVFGQVKGIHVVRHGLDVARSMVERHHNNPNKGLPRIDSLLDSPLSWLLAGNKKYEGVRSRNLQSCLELWSEYAQRGTMYADTLGDDYLELKFEELLVNPDRETSRLAAFCGVPDQDVSDLSIEIREGRRFAYKESELAQDLAQDWAAELSRLGYETEE